MHLPALGKHACFALLVAFWSLHGSAWAETATLPGAEEYRRDVQPLLAKYCYGCHGDGAEEGGVTLDQFKSDEALVGSHELWWKVLKYLRADIMPPAGEDRPSAEERGRIEQWIKTASFRIDPANPDPGSVTVRRLNRAEYRNTIRDLVGVEYDTALEFPPDDTGHGFDNNGDVLTLSPLLLEKYLAAATDIVSQTVPTVPKVVAEHPIPGRRFQRDDGGENRGRGGGLSYYEPTKVSANFKAEHAGKYQLVVDLSANDRYVENQFDYNRCRLIFKADGEELWRQEFAREGGKKFRVEFDREWQAGEHRLAFELEPLTKEEQVRSLTIRIQDVTVRGPHTAEHFVKPKNYERYFPRDVPPGAAQRQAYARELLRGFARQAFRRPVDDETVDRLAALAESIYSRPEVTFEAGVSQAMVAVLASPRFLFREEGLNVESRAAVGHGLAEVGKESFPLVDEHALASRLSYFLWSTMPDGELFRLADENKLRENLPAQMKRMLSDWRAAALMQNFVGQWLRARDIDSVQINEIAVILGDEVRPPGERGQRRRGGFNRARFREFELTGELRRAMKRETEMLFEHLLREDRSLLELIDSNYTFLNEKLAKHYGIPGVSGSEMRLVKLPEGSPRGGVLTQGTLLAVTSNPDRTSPVKRGLFLLENILGAPPAPPPPDIPALEETAKGFKDREPTLREVLEMHRANPQCASCHDRMDPLGLALENFNALGLWREKQRDQPISVAGKLVTGEEFTNIQELKKILVNNRRKDFYHCVAEKMMTYALGRGLQYYDVQAVDAIAERLEKEGGKPSALLMGVIESAPFQRSRDPLSSTAESNIEPQQQAAVERN